MRKGGDQGVGSFGFASLQCYSEMKPETFLRFVKGSQKSFERAVSEVIYMQLTHGIVLDVRFICRISRRIDP